MSQSGDQGSSRKCSNSSWGNLTSQYVGLVVLPGIQDNGDEGDGIANSFFFFLNACLVIEKATAKSNASKLITSSI